VSRAPSAKSRVSAPGAVTGLPLPSRSTVSLPSTVTPVIVPPNKSITGASAARLICGSRLRIVPSELRSTNGEKITRSTWTPIVPLSSWRNSSRAVW
jgi:hypothetical protein